MRNRISTGTVVSREVDEHGTHSVIEGVDAALTLRYTGHETMHEAFARIVAHVGHADPLPGPVPDAVWRTETFAVFGLDVAVTYGAGAGLKIAAGRGAGAELVAGHLPAHLVTLQAAGGLYGQVLNRACEQIVQGRELAHA